MNIEYIRYICKLYLSWY